MCSARRGVLELSSEVRDRSDQRYRLAKSNAEQVEKIVRIGREFGIEFATPDEARQILDLKGQDEVGF